MKNISFKLTIDIILAITAFLYISSIAYHIFAGYTGNPLHEYPWFIINIILFEEMDSKALTLSLFGSLGILVVLISSIGGGFKNENIFGDAHWATYRIIKKMGLFANTGILLGKYFNKYLCIKGNKHVLLYGPTESFKGVGFVIPNLLNWSDSLVMLDIKKENYEKTSGFRAKHGQQVFLWDPANTKGHSCCFNPLDIISKESITRIVDIQKIAAIIWPPKEDGGQIWNPGARSLFTGLVLYSIDFTENPTFGKILRMVSSTPDFTKFLKQLITDHYDDMDRLCVENFNLYIQTPDNTRGGIMKQLLSGITLWEDPVIDAATSKSDFDLRDLRKKLISIYVGVNPGDLERLAPLLNLFFQLLVDLTVREMPDKKTDPYKILLFLDEFTALGYMSVFEKANSYIRAYGLLMGVVIQDLIQFYVVYGRDPGDVILSNFKVQIAYAQNSLETANKISTRLGTMTIKSRSQSQQSGTKFSSSTNTSPIKRDLMMPHEIMTIGDKRSIVIVEGQPPIKAKKIFYFKDKNFKSRVLPQHPIPTIDLVKFISALPKPEKPDFRTAKEKEDNQPPKMSQEELDDLMGVMGSQY